MTVNNNEPESSDSLRAWGEVLKAFRRRAGLTQEQLAPIVGYSTSFVSSVEQGRRMPPWDLVERAEAALDAFGALKGPAKYLTRARRVASYFRQWSKLEETARILCTYECRLIPGLLQTERYMSVMMAQSPSPIHGESIEERASNRLARQQMLFGRAAPIQFSFIIEQAVLERRSGGDDVTRELLDHLIAQASLPNVKLQVMPLHCPDHPSQDGPLYLMETADHEWYGYTESHTTGQVFYERKHVSRLQECYARLRSHALTPADSLSLLKRMREAL
ncbi:helix-turn-helix transcriptional regulator [Streptomyces coeruleoprunus]|uniref:Helix-turn-helix transcriptional regulator n=1 Tax=Streptomyces coeruleoprunus TaxID=285563 RepID=A0ABV9XE57_9ACTN